MKRGGKKDLLEGEDHITRHLEIVSRNLRMQYNQKAKNLDDEKCITMNQRIKIITVTMHHNKILSIYCTLKLV